jgi:hypothetical protein
MDADRFDRLSRRFSDSASRRRLLGSSLGGVLVAFGREDTEAKRKHGKNKKRNEKRKKKPTCPSGQRACEGACIPERDCCSPWECRARGVCANCLDGQCVSDGLVCRALYGPCYACDSTSFTCVPQSYRYACDTCSYCDNGACVNCFALGECATCSGDAGLGDACIASDVACAVRVGPCWTCNPTTYTCEETGPPCSAAEREACSTASEACQDAVVQSACHCYCSCPEADGACHSNCLQAGRDGIQACARATPECHRTCNGREISCGPGEGVGPICLCAK